MKKILSILSKYRLVVVIGLLTALSQLAGLLPTYLDWLKYLFLACSVLLAGYIKYSEIEPDLRFEDKRTFFLENACYNPMERLRNFDATARLNIMEVGGIGPESMKSLDIIYDLFVEDDHPDRWMEMDYTQGVCRDAVRKGALCYADISDPERPTFGLTDEQLKKTEHVTFVMSMLIRKAVTAPNGRTRLADEIVGVVNIDSGQSDPENFYKSTLAEGETLLERQKEALRKISEYCSRVLS